MGSLATGSSPESSRGTRASVTVRLLKSAKEREECAVRPRLRRLRGGASPAYLTRSRPPLAASGRPAHSRLPLALAVPLDQDPRGVQPGPLAGRRPQASQHAQQSAARLSIIDRPALTQSLTHCFRLRVSRRAHGRPALIVALCVAARTVLSTARSASKPATHEGRASACSVSAANASKLDIRYASVGHPSRRTKSRSTYRTIYTCRTDWRVLWHAVPPILVIRMEHGMLHGLW